MTITGESEWTSTYCCEPTGHCVGAAVITAANGDEIYLSLTHDFNPVSGDWTQSEVIAGGTGKFVGATGESISSGTATFTGPTTDIWQGQVAGIFTPLSLLYKINSLDNLFQFNIIARLRFVHRHFVNRWLEVQLLSSAPPSVVSISRCFDCRGERWRVVGGGGYRATCGGVPERPKGADCKSAGDAYGGSNPPPSTSIRSEEYQRPSCFRATAG